MWKWGILTISIYELFCNFIIYSFFGWIYESCYVSLKKKQWVNRGFLNGPIIPIYGYGATMLHVVFIYSNQTIGVIHNSYAQFFYVFFVGMLAATILEYFTSLIMELIFHTRWWDYSHYKFNINGRISLVPSLFWGLLSVMMVYFIQPIVNKLIESLPLPQFYYVGDVIVVLICFDLVITSVSALQLDQHIATMQRVRNEFIAYVESTKIFETQEGLKNRLSEMSLMDAYTHMKEHLEEHISHLKEHKIPVEVIRERRSELEKQWKELLTNYQKHISKKDFVQKRLLNAFPNMKMKNREQALKDYQNKNNK